MTRIMMTASMTIKALEDVFRSAKAWPVEDQRELAEFAREIEARRTGTYLMSDDELSKIREGLIQADRHEFVPDEIVA